MPACEASVHFPEREKRGGMGRASERARAREREGGREQARDARDIVRKSERL